MKSRSLGLLSILSCGGFVLVGLGAAGCGSSSNAPPANDGATDLAKDVAIDVAEVSHDTASEVATGDAADAGDAPAPGTTTQTLTLTVIVTDQIGGDGGFDAGTHDAAADAAEAGADGSASDAPALPTVDPHLVNPWGLGLTATGDLWVAANAKGLGLTYGTAGQIEATVVTVPAPADGGVPPSAPTELLLNASTTAFMADKVIFATEDGTISGWQTGATALLRVDNSAAASVYKGLAIATMNGVSRLYATDFHNGTVDVFDQSYAKVAAGFSDPNIPAGFAPFGIQSAASLLWVTYAKQDTMKHDDMAGVGNGYVDVFDFNGNLTKRLISQGALNSPWALVVAPADFGAFSGALLVGNFGDGHINAYDVATGVLRGAALDTTGTPLKIDGLWSLVFGNDTTGAAHNRLFFTAGPDMEMHGLLGHLDLP
jgi:uncharacterized protein (TIGR03118 family)